MSTGMSFNSFSAACTQTATSSFAQLCLKSQTMQFSTILGKLLPWMFTTYATYLCFALWYNFLLLPLFMLVPFVTYKYIGGLLFMNIFGYFPKFFSNLFVSYNLDETDVGVWYNICCENWKNGSYFEVIKLLIETHNNILATTFNHNQQSHVKQQTTPAKQNEKSD